MNKIWKSILSLLLFLLAFTQIDLINAKENENIPREIEMLFSGLDDNESVIELPNGGYIYGDGKVKIFDYLDYIEGKLVPIETYDLNKDINKIYISKAFSGSGWRFSGYQFVADPNTGYYLKWTTYIDDGRVGSASYANDTLRGQTRGAEIYKDQSKYISYGPNGQIYYTYNPINGTYYRVENN